MLAVLRDPKAFLLVQKAFDVSPRRPSRRVHESTIRNYPPSSGIPPRGVFSADGYNFTRGARVRMRGNHLPDAALFLNDVAVDLNG